MKTTIALTVLLAFAVSASAAKDDKTKKTPTPTPAAPATKIAQPLTIPKDAVANPDGTFNWTDKQGKKWVFSNTPFGVSRVEYTVPAPVGGTDTIKVVDKGDSIIFEQPGPFGTMIREKKKSDLTPQERSIVDARKAKSE